MAEVNFRSWSEISQASEGLQLNSTSATLEHILARFARLETRLVEHERRVASTLPPLQPEPDPPDRPRLYAASQPQFQSTCHQPLYAATTTQYQIDWTGYQQNCPPPHAASSPWLPYPTVQITPPYQTDKYQHPSTYQPSQPVQPQCSTFWDPPTCWETPGHRTFLESSAYDQLPYHSNAPPQNPYVGYHPGQLEYQLPEPPYQPLQPWLHLDHSLQQPSLAQSDADFGLPSYTALDTYAAPSSYVLLKNSSWDVLECGQKESLIVDCDRVGVGFDDSTEKFVHSSARFCGFEKVDVDGNSEAREDDGAKERKIVGEDAVQPQHLECFMDNDGHTFVPIELVDSLVGKRLDKGNDRIDDSGENQDRDRVDKRESLVLDIDIIEEPIYTMLEVMEIVEDENSLAFHVNGSHFETMLPLSRRISVEPNGVYNWFKQSCIFDPGGNIYRSFYRVWKKSEAFIGKRIIIQIRHMIVGYWCTKQRSYVFDPGGDALQSFCYRRSSLLFLIFTLRTR